MKQGYFITGTGTGVGKTFVTAALTRRATTFGKRVFAFKPIETGVTQNIGEDQKTLNEAAGAWQTGDLLGIYRFPLPAAPSVAATTEISFSKILTTLKQGSDQADLTLVEGAGGWRVPIDDRHDMGSLAKACGYPIIVVAAATLGTINHSLLTVEAIERDGQSVAALVLSQHSNDPVDLIRTNVEQIGTRWRGTILVLSSDPSVLDPLL